MDLPEPNNVNRSVDSVDSASNPKRDRTSLHRSQRETAYPTLKLLAYVKPDSDLAKSNMEFHMTIRPKISELTPKHASMLLSIGVARAVYVGVDFTLYLALEFLQNYLKKSGVDPLYIKNEKVRQTYLLAELVLTCIGGSWLNFLEVEKLPEQVIEEIVSTSWLPSDRTLQSWKQHWDLERYLEVRIVPVEHFLHRVPNTAERYSSYTRGYGQDGNATEPGKTRPSPELDGDNFTEEPPSFTLLELDKYNTVLLSIERSRAAKRNK